MRRQPLPLPQPPLDFWNSAVRWRFQVVGPVISASAESVEMISFSTLLSFLITFPFT